MKKTWIAGLTVGALLLSAVGAFAAADGKALFTSKCAMCHGAGKAHALAGKMKGKSDAFLMEKSFTKPPAGMPKVTLTPAEQQAVINYLKTL